MEEREGFFLGGNLTIMVYFLREPISAHMRCNSNNMYIHREMMMMMMMIMTTTTVDIIID